MAAKAKKTSKNKDRKVEKKKLNPGEEFRFACSSGVDCFTQCCADVTIFLSPYDVMRIKNRLGIPSDEFLDKYTLSPFFKELTTPIRILKMKDDKKKTCPFVSEKGCSIYEDRPWPCRMFPVSVEVETVGEDNQPNEYDCLICDNLCLGFENPEAKPFTMESWIADQDIEDYNQMDLLFQELRNHKYFQVGGALRPEKMEMFHLAMFDIDNFRRFVLDTKFLKVFDVDQRRIETIRTGDMELLKFGFDWLRFCLFGETTLKLNEVAEKVAKKGTEDAEVKAKTGDDVVWFKKKK